MLASTSEMLGAAQRGGYAIGGFNIYNLEGIKAVVDAAEQLSSSVLLQLHPAALDIGGMPLIDLCLSYARHARVPVGVHLDHTTSRTTIQNALDAGVRSVMADGSHLPYAENVAFVRDIVRSAHSSHAVVEAELGRISGTEDGLTVTEMESRMTVPQQARQFVEETGADMLAVCIGNVHGPYRLPPRLDFARLEQIRDLVEVPLVLHGASGLGSDLIRQSIRLGVCKFNVNTEVRQAYLHALRSATHAPDSDLTAVMQASIRAMGEIVNQKIELFGSKNSAE